MDSAMPTTETTAWLTADPLAEALAEYEMAHDEGRPLDRQAFLEQHAAVAADLAPLLDALERIDALARPFRSAMEGKPSLPFPHLEGYEILQEIGRGGMGVVYKARQKGTEQLVALKMLRPGSVGQEIVEQFRIEAQAAARLRHPNRVRILHLGEHEGQPFYAMELIDGCSLAEKASQPNGLSKGAAVKYLASVAEAAHEAHQHGILHRDVKPHNILIDQSSDEALLADFGLARMSSPLAAGEGNVRQHARLAGTLPYMSPEQTQDADSVDERSDVYSLGATLYELLTGTPPFQAESRQQLLDKIRHEEPIPIRQRRPDVSPRIEQICLKCLEKRPEHRYPTALELAHELRRYLREVHVASNFTTMGTLYVVLGPVVLFINLLVFLLLRIHYSEPVIWLVIFSMYPALFSVFLLAPRSEVGQESAITRLELWSIWGGKMFAAISISIAMRVAFPHEPERVLHLVYPVFAALSGMAAFAMCSKMEWKLYALPATVWLVGIAMAFYLEWAPILYGILCCLGLPCFGLYLRRLGKELE